MLLMITLHVIRHSLRLKGGGNGTRLGLDSRAFAERGQCRASVRRHRCP